MMNHELQRELLQKIAELELELAKARQIADFDGLTGLLRREAFYRILEEKKTQGFLPKNVVVAVVDIDHFKKINDTMGHAAGDEILKSVAHVLRANSLQGALVCRMGGEEFVVVLESNQTEAHWILEALRRDVERTTTVTISVGMATWDTDRPLEPALEKADEALYRAKNNGRNQLAA